MSIDLSSLGSLASVGPLDLASPNMTGGTDAARIKQVSKAMEYIFTSQLTAEMGKSVDTSEESQDGGDYSDFMHQALTQGMTSGRGLGLAKNIEEFMTRHVQARPPATPALSTTTIHHAPLHTK
jgi:Rod binding domain-containing protein